jgi:zinc protease
VRLASAALLALVAIAHADPAPALPVDERVLDNGLRVILAPDRDVASVVVHVRYHGGAADEPDGRAGFTHLVERLLFAGTTHVADLDARIDAAGGWTSSTTALDHLNVVDHVPAGALELALWLEAERMAGLADALTGERLDRERAAIAAEVRAAYDDHPYARVPRAIQQALWPTGDGNAHLVLGNGRDLAAATPSDVAAFARAYLAPNNATLVIAGRFDPTRATELVRRYFGWIPGRARAPAATAPVVTPLATPATVVVDGSVSEAAIAFRIGAPDAPDTADCEVIARMLAGGGESRVWRQLVGGALATEAHADVLEQARGGELRIVATVRPGIDPRRVASELRAAVAELRDHPIADDEVARARTNLEAELVTGLEGLAFRAETLAVWASSRGRADGLADARARLRAVTPASVQRAARRWLADTATVIVIGRGAAR